MGFIHGEEWTPGKKVSLSLICRYLFIRYIPLGRTLPSNLLLDTRIRLPYTPVSSEPVS
jgi:hypothetical protein